MFKKGDMVKWYELGADGFVLHDSGHGIVLREQVLALSGGMYSRYEVFRTKRRDKMIFSEIHLEAISD
ncbi:hypothetical protein CMI47_15710 [Candidatus Pacearchaeota archaeon]|nr:hypothetical protein [Candidatus Pacearchaeota archaeon]